MKIVSIIALGFALLLSACGDSGPSAAEIAAALEVKGKADIQSYIDKMGALHGEYGRKSVLAETGQPDAFKVSGVAIDEIKPKGKDEYVVKIGATLHMNGKAQQGRSVVTIVKDGESWKVITAEKL
jgi:hypothetical protein